MPQFMVNRMKQVPTLYLVAIKSYDQLNKKILKYTKMFTSISAGVGDSLVSLLFFYDP